MTTIKTRPDRVRALRAAAHHLTDATRASSLVEAAAACGLADVTPGFAAIALAARVPSAEPSDVSRALLEERSLAIVWSRRGMPCLVPSADVNVFTLGLRPDDEESWQETMPGFVSHLDTVGMTATELVAVANDAVLEALDGRQLTKRELLSAVAAKMPVALKTWFDEGTISSFVAVLARAAALNGTFLVVPAHEGEATFALTAQWLGVRPDDSGAAAEVARRELVRRYLHAYGPSSSKAFAEWAGTGEGAARRAFEAIGGELVAASVEGAHGYLLGDDAALLDDPPAPDGISLLPAHDAYLASPDRRVIVPDAALHKRLWRSAGNPGAVLAHGEIVAAWRANKRGSRLELEVATFRTLPAAMVRAIELQAPRLTAFTGANIVKIDWR